MNPEEVNSDMENMEIANVQNCFSIWGHGK